MLIRRASLNRVWRGPAEEPRRRRCESPFRSPGLAGQSSQRCLARRAEHGSTPAIPMVVISRKAASVDTATLLARVAILSLSAVACLAVVAQALLLASCERPRAWS